MIKLHPLRYRWFVIVLIIMVCKSTPHSSLSLAQDSESTIGLTATQHDLARLAPAPAGPLSAQVPVVIDDVGDITIVINSTNADITTSITTPFGEINETTIAGFGGQLLTYGDMQAAESGIMPGLFFGRGYHSVYLLPSPGPGTYMINLVADPALAEEVAVVITTTLDSPVTTMLATTTNTATLGQTVVVTAGVFENVAAVADALVSTRVLTPSETELNPALLDNEVSPDFAAGDGLYSGMFQVTELGEYIVSVEITGNTSPLGTAFRRHNSISIEVIEQSGTLPPSAVNYIDYGEDDNGNLLFERLVIEALNVNVVTAGTYALRVLLETPEATPQSLVTYGEADLVVGLNSIKSSVTAEEIRRVDYSGVYNIKSVELMLLSANGLVTVDEITGNLDPTQSYNVSQFERPPIELVEVSFVYPTDDVPFDGDYDALIVVIVLDLLYAGDYSYQVTLVDDCGKNIETASATATLPAGVSVPLELVFDGAKIGSNGVDSPYYVRDFTISKPAGVDPAASLTVDELTTINNYFANQFDSFTPFTDCNTNSIPDLCEIANGTKADCHPNGIPDECEIHINDGGFCTSGSCSSDCQPNGIPDECETVLYVSAAAAAGGDGSSWQTAYQNPRDALGNTTCATKEIWVAAGTYRPDETGNREWSFDLVNGVVLFGGFAGFETQRATCEGGSSFAKACFTDTDCPGGTCVDIRDFGTCEGGEDAGTGCTLPSDCPNGTCTNLTVLTGDLSVADVACTQDYECSNLGGECVAGACIDTRTDNSLHVISARNVDTTAGLNGFTIMRGHADGIAIDEDHGGGILTLYSSPTLSNLTIAQNYALVDGGGIWNDDGSPVLRKCTLLQNEAESGGGFGTSGGSPSLINCTFLGNVASTEGGGVVNRSGGPMALVNCILSGNSMGPTGAAVYVDTGGLATLTNCSITQNTGGGVSSLASTSSVSIENSIVWNNSVFQLSGVVATNSCVQGGYPGSGNINADPLFINDKGIDSIPGTRDDDLRLSRGSPCIDAGNDSFVIDPSISDSDGNVRQRCDVDIGAFEFPILFADRNATLGGDGQNWGTAFKYLQDALAAADSYPGHVDIWVSDGTYLPDRGTGRTFGDRLESFQLRGGVGIYGGFAGISGPQESCRSERNWQTNKSILSGDIAGNDKISEFPEGTSYSDNSYHVVTASSLIQSSVVDGFEISGGNANFAPDNNGGGLLTSGGASPSIRNSFFTMNSAHKGGGASLGTGFTSLIGNTFYANKATLGTGGAVRAEASSAVTIINTQFFGNLSSDSTSGAGGAVASEADSMAMTNCLFSGNTAGTSGGAVWTNQGTLTVVNSSFAGNSAGSGGGGALSVTASGSASVANSILWGNTDQVAGGSVEDAQLTAEAGATLAVTTSCIDGLDALGVFGGDPTNIGNDPLLADADGNDSVRGTMDDDLRLLDLSPAIDAGNSSYLPPDATDLDADFDVSEPTPLDLDGNTRDQCIVDMGAYEFPIEQTQAPTIDTQFESGFATARTIAVLPGNPGDNNAMRVSLVQSGLFPDAIESPPRQWWVGQPFQVCENSGDGFAKAPPNCGPAPGLSQKWIWIARNGCDEASAHYMDWTVLDDYCTISGESCDPANPVCGQGTCGVDGVVHIFGQRIVPSGIAHQDPQQDVPDTIYEIQTINDACNSTDESNFSAPLVVEMARWGDTVGIHENGIWEAPDDDVDILDIIAVLDKFSNVLDAPMKARSDLEPEELDMQVNISDVLKVNVAFTGTDYPFSEPCCCAGSTCTICP